MERDDRELVQVVGAPQQDQLLAAFNSAFTELSVRHDQGLRRLEEANQELQKRMLKVEEERAQESREMKQFMQALLSHMQQQAGVAAVPAAGVGYGGGVPVQAGGLRPQPVPVHPLPAGQGVQPSVAGQRSDQSGEGGAKAALSALLSQDSQGDGIAGWLHQLGHGDVVEELKQGSVTERSHSV